MVSFQKDSHLLGSSGMFGVGFLLVFPHFLAALKVVVGGPGVLQNCGFLRQLMTLEEFLDNDSTVF